MVQVQAKKFEWSEERILELIDCYYENKERISTGRWSKMVSDMWLCVTDDLKKKELFGESAASLKKDNVRMKFNKVTQVYRSYKDNLAVSGAGKPKLPKSLTPAIVEKLDEYYYDSPSVNPEITCEIGTGESSSITPAAKPPKKKKQKVFLTLA